MNEEDLINKVNSGDRVLYYVVGIADHIMDAEVLAVTKTAVRLKFPNGREVWELKNNPDPMIRIKKII